MSLIYIVPKDAQMGPQLSGHKCMKEQFLALRIFDVCDKQRMGKLPYF